MSRAEYALERARSLFELGKVRKEYGDVENPDPHDGTLILRDLALTKDGLTGEDRRRANRILARPTDGRNDPQEDGYAQGTVPVTQCQDLSGTSNPEVCYTWVGSSSDAVANVDSSPSNGTPDHVDAAMATMSQVWQTEISDLGFKKPQTDSNSAGQSGDPALDIYFADIGDDGLYGYCTTDEPGARNKKRVSAYCVLDNNYDPNQYDAPPPEVSGLDALRITLAHEFFHAIQFNYDWREALFLMEGTAVWMENQVFDNIDAAYAYLFDSPLMQPEIPLDAFQGDDDENFEYGSFIFFTWLAEAFGPGFPGSDPEIIRQVWVQAGGNKRGIGAVRQVVTDRGYAGPSTSFRNFFAEWGAANYYYDAFYEEGWLPPTECSFQANSLFDSLRCLRAPTDAQFGLGLPGAKTGTHRVPMDRLSNRYVEFAPLVSGPNDLRVTVDLPRRSRGGEATVLILPNTFFPFSHRIKLNDAGNGSKRIDFAGSVSTVHLVLSNTGPHNKETYKFKAEVLQP